MPEGGAYLQRRSTWTFTAFSLSARDDMAGGATAAAAAAASGISNFLPFGWIGKFSGRSGVLVCQGRGGGGIQNFGGEWASVRWGACALPVPLCGGGTLLQPWDLMGPSSDGLGLQSQRPV